MQQTDNDSSPLLCRMSTVFLFVCLILAAGQTWSSAVWKWTLNKVTSSYLFNIYYIHYYYIIYIIHMMQISHFLYFFVSFLLVRWYHNIYHEHIEMYHLSAIVTVYTKVTIPLILVLSTHQQHDEAVEQPQATHQYPTDLSWVRFVMTPGVIFVCCVFHPPVLLL